MIIRALAALRSLLYAGVFLTLWWWVVVAVRPYDERLAFALPDWLRPPGLALIGCGAVILAWCLFAFSWVGRGTPAPFDAPRRIVASGPYRYVRNPMYLGAMLVILGVGMRLGSPSASAVSLFFLVLAHLFVVLYEEPALERSFGDSYRRYKRSVDRWMPRRPRDS